MLTWITILAIMTATIGGPYIATRVVQDYDWKMACGSKSLSLLTDDSGRWWIANAEIGHTTVQDAADGSGTTLTFQGTNVPASVAANPITSVNIALDRMGNGVVTGACSNGNLPCDLASGSITVRAKKQLTGANVKGSSASASSTAFASNDGDWGNNPFALDATGDSRAVYTVAQPAGPGVRVCSDSNQLAFLTAALVKSFQGRVAGCGSCYDHCLDCCTEDCYPVTTYSTVCSGSGTSRTCSQQATTTIQCHCVGCSMQTCIGTCSGRCVGVGPPT